MNIFNFNNSSSRNLLFRLLSGVIVAYFLLFLPFGHVIAEEYYGIWVEAEGKVRPFDSRGNFDDYLKLIEDHSFTDIFCQIYRGGRSWFPSKIADTAPFEKAQREGFDPLRDTIKRAHARGQKVHAWINTLRVAHNQKAPVLDMLGRDVVLHDNQGNSILQYDGHDHPPGKLRGKYRVGTPGIWLDASHARLRQYMIEVVREIVANYPEIDGIHLDMVRSPLPMLKAKGRNRLRFGHGDHAVGEFQRLTGLTDTSGKDWENFRRSQTSLLVMQIKEMLEREAPGVMLTAAVVGRHKRAYDWAYQDWPSWVESGVLDYVVPMAYSKKTKSVNEMAKYAMTKRGNQKVLMGLGAWLVLDKPEQMIRQIEAVKREQVDGFVLFSYANLQNSKGREMLRALESHLVVEP